MKPIIVVGKMVEIKCPFMYRFLGGVSEVRSECRQSTEQYTHRSLPYITIHHDTLKQASWGRGPTVVYDGIV